MVLILSGMVNICQLVAGIPTFSYLDRLGRQPLAIVSGFAMATRHLIRAGIVAKYDSTWGSYGAVGRLA